MVNTQNPGRQTSRPGGLVRPGLMSAQLPRVEIDSRTAYDFLTSACNDCGEFDDLLPDDRRWLEESRANTAAQVGSDIFVQTCSGFVAELGRMLVGRP